MSKSFVSCFLLLLSPKVYGMFRPRQNGIDTRVRVRERPPRKGSSPRSSRPGSDRRLEAVWKNKRGASQRMKSAFLLQRGPVLPVIAGHNKVDFSRPFG
jgi:hypothetical protein